MQRQTACLHAWMLLHLATYLYGKKGGSPDCSLQGRIARVRKHEAISTFIICSACESAGMVVYSKSVGYDITNTFFSNFQRLSRTFFRVFSVLLNTFSAVARPLCTNQYKQTVPVVPVNISRHKKNMYQAVLLYTFALRCAGRYAP